MKEPLPLYPYCCKDSRPCPAVSQYQLGAPVTKATGHLRLYITMMAECVLFPPGPLLFRMSSLCWLFISRREEAKLTCWEITLPGLRPGPGKLKTTNWIEPFLQKSVVFTVWVEVHVGPPPPLLQYPYENGSILNGSKFFLLSADHFSEGRKNCFESTAFACKFFAFRVDPISGGFKNILKELSPLNCIQSISISLTEHFTYKSIQRLPSTLQL